MFRCRVEFVQLHDEKCQHSAPLDSCFARKRRRGKGKSRRGRFAGPLWLSHRHGQWGSSRCVFVV